MENGEQRYKSWATCGQRRKTFPLNPTRWISRARGNCNEHDVLLHSKMKTPETHQPLSLSHGAQPQSHATTNTSCKFSTVSRHESGERSEHISVSLKLPSLPQPRRRQRIITVNIVTQVSFSPFFGPVSQYVEQQMFHLWLASRRRVPVFEHLVLYSIYYSPVGSYRARQRGSLLSWTDGPLLQVAGSSTETEAAIGIEVYI